MNKMWPASHSRLSLRVNCPCLVRALLVACAFVACLPAHAQTSGPARKLPAPERIVADYIKAVGGKQRQRAALDATYEWLVQLPDQTEARARTVRKAPDATRMDIFAAGGETNAAANARTAWRRAPDGSLHTLSGGAAQVAKLQAALEASQLLELKKRDVLARTVAYESAPDTNEPVYVVEFSRRDGARLRCRFGAQSKLLLQVVDEARPAFITYEDYRAEAGGMLEPHRVRVAFKDSAPLVFTLQSVRYNTKVADALFEPPGDATLNISALLREVGQHQRELDARISEYTFTRTETEREFNDRGEVRKEKTTVHEVYPLLGGGRVLKLLSENGVPLAPERAAREEKRVGEEIEKATREHEKRAAKRERERAERAQKAGAGEQDDDNDLGGIGAFLRACEFVAPRRERFHERDAIVFDFRARPGFKPANRNESLIAKLTGVMWIDPLDRQVIRLEARLPEGYKMGGGLVASIRPGSAFAFEQTRQPDGVWLPRFAQVNAAAKLFIFAGVKVDATREYSNYKRFSTNVGDAAVEAPKPPPPQP
ncbi:MAG: hypothetical protein ACJ74W_03155 [Pyrinomonadaceae bacterium]